MRRGKRVTRLGVTATLTVGILALIAVIAGAATVVQKNFKIPAGAAQKGSVACPNGDAPTSGGFTLQQDFTSLELQESHPTPGGWAVEARSDEHEKRSGAALSMCVKDHGLTARSKKKTTDPGEADLQLTAKCPDGSKAVGGGGQVAGKKQANQRGSFPVSAGKAWTTDWHVFGDSAVTLKAYAICDKRIRGYNVVDASGDIQARKHGTLGSGTAVAKCEGSDKLAGGGYFRLDYLTFFTRVGPKNGGWEVSANGYQAGGPLLSFAVCGK